MNTCMSLSIFRYLKLLTGKYCEKFGKFFLNFWEIRERGLLQYKFYTILKIQNDWLKIGGEKSETIFHKNELL